MGKFIDLTGKRFGELVVQERIKYLQPSGYHSIKWRCLCDCGTEVIRDGHTIRKGITRSCGACKKNTNITGRRFGKLVAIERGAELGRWLCLCDCGSMREYNIYSLLRSNTKSCGCTNIERLIKRNKKGSTHGMTNSRLYNIWDTMRARCHRQTSKDYRNYGARGIKVYDEWKGSFEAFYNWALNNGYQDHLTLDRKNVNGNYEPSNCRWTTTKQQGNNTRVNHKVTINGETKTLSEWSEFAGISPKAFRYRVMSGWQEESLLLPVGVQKVHITIGEETKTISEWSKQKGVAASLISKRYKQGLTGEELFQTRQKNLSVEINGETKTLKDWSRETGIEYSTIHRRYSKGIRGADLLTPTRKRTNDTTEQLSLDLNFE